MSRHHAWMDSWCATLSRILVGRAAEQLLDEGLPPDAGLVLLPSWMWRVPRADVGRKAKAPGGGSLLLPLRLAWEPGPLVAVGDEPVEVAWSAEGLGFSEAGTCTLLPHPGRVWDAVRPDEWEGVPETLRVGRMEDGWARRLACDLAADGQAAWWEALMGMEAYVRQAVRRAASHVSMDVGGGVEAPALLDQVSLEQVTDEMILGAGEGDQPPVARIVAHSLQPGAFARVDPQRYVAQTVHREAQQAVRRRLGDPKSGARIRRLARELGFDGRDDEEAVAATLAAYREQRPNERMGAGRVRAALTVTPEATCRQVSLSVLGDIEGGERWLASAS